GCWLPRKRSPRARSAAVSSSPVPETVAGALPRPGCGPRAVTENAGTPGSNRISEAKRTVSCISDKCRTAYRETQETRPIRVQRRRPGDGAGRHLTEPPGRARAQSPGLRQSLAHLRCQRYRLIVRREGVPSRRHGRDGLEGHLASRRIVPREQITERETDGLACPEHRH